MTYGNDEFVPILLGTGVGAYNIARSLHEAFGVRSLALGRVALRETSHSRILDVRASREFDKPEAVVAALLALADEFPGRPLLLIGTVEYYVNVLIDHREGLGDRFIIPLVDRELADRLINKTDFYATCDSLGVPHPRSVFLTPAARGDAGIGEDLPFAYPVILKPSNTDVYPRLSFEGKEKVYLLDDAAAVREVAERIFAAGYQDDLIVQEYIEGDESVMRVANTYSDRSGQLRFVSVGQVVLADHDPTMVGNNNAILAVDDPDLAASLGTLLNAVGYTGSANFDVMHDRRDGVSKVLELNLRQGATSYYAMAAGGNIPARIVEDWVYGKPAEYAATTQERLWLNLPYPLAVIYAPRSLRSRVRKAARAGSKHTLWYRPDMSLKRLVSVLRVDLRYTLSTITYARSGMNR
jgi:D-aspartate ligase